MAHPTRYSEFSEDDYVGGDGYRVTRGLKDSENTSELNWIAITIVLRSATSVFWLRTLADCVHNVCTASKNPMRFRTGYMSEDSSPFPVNEPNQTAPAPADGQHRKAISVRKLIANRRNAKKSTGPRTPQGKAYSSRNALKHGLFGRPQLEFALLGEDRVTEKWEVPPRFIADVLALAGDSVDNIPGIGIGRKSAAALIRDFGGLEPLLNNIDKVKSVRTREKLANAREQISQNRKMVDLDCDMELPVAIDELRIEPDYPALIAALEKCEFKSLLQEVRDEAARVATVVQGNLL